MQGVRRFFSGHRRLSAMVIAVALCIRLLVPQGYMPAVDGARHFTVQLCSAAAGEQPAEIVIPLAGKPGSAADGSGGHGSENADGHCPFASLALASPAGADGLLVAVLLGFIVALQHTPARQCLRRAARYLRPPLRGPPAQA